MYGSAWGVVRGALAADGLRGAAGTMAFFAAVWGTELVLLPALRLAKPIWKWDQQDVSRDAGFHCVRRDDVARAACAR